MTGFGRRFDPAELGDEDELATPAELLATAGIARELEAIAERDAGIDEGFADRVMASIAKEPTPQPAVAFGAALRAGRVGSALAAIGDSFRVAFGGGRPLAVRGQAFALALLVLVGVVGTGGGVAVGAARLLTPDRTPEPTEILPSPSPSPILLPSPSPTATESPEATETAEPSDGGAGAEPTPTGTDDSPEETDDSSGPGSGDDSGSGDSSGPGSGSGSGSGSSGSGSSGSGPGDAGRAD